MTKKLVSWRIVVNKRVLSSKVILFKQLLYIFFPLNTIFLYIDYALKSPVDMFVLKAYPLISDSVLLDLVINSIAHFLCNRIFEITFLTMTLLFIRGWVGTITQTIKMCKFFYSFSYHE